MKNTNQLINIGFGNVVIASRIVAIVTPNSAPMKRFKEDARQSGRLIDVTHGRRTRSIIITDSGHILLSAVQPETVSQRIGVETRSNINKKEENIEK